MLPISSITNLSLSKLQHVFSCLTITSIGHIRATQLYLRLWSENNIKSQSFIGLLFLTSFCQTGELYLKLSY